MKEYFCKKIQRVYIPAILYISFCVIMIKPDFLESWVVVREFIFLTYRGLPESPEFSSMGVTWFVFPLMLMYFTAPILAFLYKKYSEKALAIMFVIVIIGFVNRYIWWSVGANWNVIYKSWLCNMDFFASGFGLAYLKNYGKWQLNKYVRYGLLILFALIIFSNCYMTAFQWHINWYKWGYDSIYLVMTCMYLYVFRVDRGIKYHLPRLERCAKYFSVISFEFYLFHATVFDRLSNHIGGHTALEQYFKFIIICFVITSIFSYGWHKMTAIK